MDNVCKDNEFFSDNKEKFSNGICLDKSCHEAQYLSMFLLECILVFNMHVHQLIPSLIINIQIK